MENIYAVNMLRLTGKQTFEEMKCIPHHNQITYEEGFRTLMRKDGTFNEIRWTYVIQTLSHVWT